MKTKEPVQKFYYSDIDLSYYAVDVAYSCMTNCQGGCDPYCRCSRIVGQQVDKIDIHAVVEKLRHEFCHGNKVDIYKKGKVSVADAVGYFINRIASIRRLYDVSTYQVEVCDGYYGQEIKGAYLEKNDSLDKDFQFLLDNYNDLTSLVKYLLNEEYSFLPEQYEMLNFEIQTVSKDELPKPKFMKNQECTLDLSLPIGVYSRLGKGYQLIDGNHRLAAALKNNKDLFKIIVGSV